MIKTGLQSISENTRRQYISELVRLLRADLRDRLVSVVVFGSVARNQANSNSDTDILVVSSAFDKGMSSRMDRLTKVLIRLENTSSYREMENNGLNTWVQFHPLTVSEAKLNRAIYLDMTEDAVIVYDRGRFISKVLAQLRKRLEVIGARRVFLEDGSWYWDLKPDLRTGEIVEI